MLNNDLKRHYPNQKIKGPDDFARVSDCKNNPYSSMIQIRPYMFEATYLDTDDQFAKEYFESANTSVVPSGCSSFVKDGLFCRTFDWRYDDKAEFIIHTPARNGKRQVDGIASNVGLTPKEVLSGLKSELYNILPYYLVDGKNDCGLVISTNIVPTDKGLTTGTTPLVETKDTISSMMVVRYLLDRCKSAQEAVELIRDYISIYVPAKLQAMGFEQHWLIADKDKSYCLEIVQNEIKIIEASTITNFYLYDMTAESTVYTPADVSDGNLPSSQGITPHGQGLERYNLILSSNKDVYGICEDLLYTHAYQSSTDPYWYSEFVGGDLTVDNPVDDFEEIVGKAQQAYAERVRDGKTWQSVHAVVYDIANQTFKFKSQEEEGWSEPLENGYYTKENTPDNSPLVIYAEENQTAQSLQVPKITIEQAYMIYNAVASGKSCVIVDATETTFHPVLQVDIVPGYPAILIQYYWVAYIDYQVLENDTIEITVHNITTEE